MAASDDLVALASVKSAIKALEAEQAEIEKRLIKDLETRGRKSVRVDLGEQGRVSGTLVKGTRIVIDDARLQGALSAKQWEKVTTRVLDKEKLEANVVTGEVDPNVVASCSSEVDVKPYIRVSGKVAQPQGNKVLFENGAARVVSRNIKRNGKRVRPPRKVVK